MKSSTARAAIVLYERLSRETAFLVIDRRGQLEGHAATFVVSVSSENRTSNSLRFAIVPNDFQHAVMCF